MFSMNKLLLASAFAWTAGSHSIRRHTGEPVEPTEGDTTLDNLKCSAVSVVEKSFKLNAQQLKENKFYTKDKALVLDKLLPDLLNNTTHILNLTGAVKFSYKRSLNGEYNEVLDHRAYAYRLLAQMVSRDAIKSVDTSAVAKFLTEHLRDDHPLKNIEDTTQIKIFMRPFYLMMKFDAVSDDYTAGRGIYQFDQEWRSLDSKSPLTVQMEAVKSAKKFCSSSETEKMHKCIHWRRKDTVDWEKDQTLKNMRRRQKKIDEKTKELSETIMEEGADYCEPWKIEMVADHLQEELDEKLTGKYSDRSYEDSVETSLYIESGDDCQAWCREKK